MESNIKLLSIIHFIIKRLLCSKNSITSIAKTRENIAVLVEASVKGGNVDIHVRVRFRNLGNTLRCSDDRHKLDVLAALVLQKLNRITSTSLCSISLGSLQ